MCVCMYVCMYVCIYVSMYVGTYVCMKVCMFVCMYVCVYYVFMYVYTMYDVGRVAQSVQRLPTGWTDRGSNPGGGEIFRTSPDRP